MIETPKVVLAYCATSDQVIMRRLERSLNMQSEIPLAAHLERVLIIDRLDCELPNIVRDFFGDNIIACDPFISDDQGKLQFCLSRFRNESFRTARKMNAKWLFLCDSDTVISHFSVPNDDIFYCIPEVYWQRSEDETIFQSLEIISSDSSPYSPSNSWFILRSEIFSNFEFNENMYGWGYEDWEFNERIWAAGYQLFKSENRIIHAFHPHKDRNIDSRQVARNEAIYNSSCLATKYNLQSPWNTVEIAELFHPEWQDFIWLSHEKSIAIHAKKDVVGQFELTYEGLMIKWPNGITAFFVCRDKSYHFTNRTIID